MNNFLRFLIGLLALLVGTILVVVIILVLSPIILGTTIALGSLLLIGLALFGIASFFAFIWYLSRREPEDTKSDSTSYSIDNQKEM